MTPDPPPVPPTVPPSQESAPRKHRRRLRFTLPGCWGALLLACLSFTPSLLPRGGVLQGLICGISAAIGYGLGVVAAYVWRAFADREARSPSRRAGQRCTARLAATRTTTVTPTAGQVPIRRRRRRGPVASTVMALDLAVAGAGHPFGVELLDVRLAAADPVPGRSTLFPSPYRSASSCTLGREQRVGMDARGVPTTAGPIAGGRRRPRTRRWPLAEVAQPVLSRGRRGYRPPLRQGPLPAAVPCTLRRAIPSDGGPERPHGRRRRR
ncbi:alpha/beta-hydrolase N-terminal domain-containing protein [Streptomyces sp. NPDC058290]|uniref:alpha/beta-hydrolase N-terminal domain-containing protein n=1 Tax=Streptomyces sp. NPDC058290 TaxID=3346426 RepID=UPI0036E61CF9